MDGSEDDDGAPFFGKEQSVGESFQQCAAHRTACQRECLGASDNPSKKIIHRLQELIAQPDSLRIVPSKRLVQLLACARRDNQPVGP